MLLIASLACTGGTTEPTDASGATGDTGRETVQLANVGTACLYGEEPAGTGTTTFVEDQPAEARVVLEDCASGCAADLAASCTVRVVSSEIVVEASGSYTVPRGQATCPAVCVQLAATCPSDPLPAGYWALDYGGGHSDGFTIPGSAPAPCATAP